MDTRGTLVEAAKTLIWERGVEATSPHALLAASGVGQGSLYHHFHGKDDWARAAIAALAADLTAETEAVLADPDRPGLGRLTAYLDRPRGALAGCRLGRLAFDPRVAGSESLQAPISDYFTRLCGLLSDAVRAAVLEGDLARHTDPDALAVTLAAVVQGGYVLARSSGDAGAMTAAVRGMRDLLRSSS